MSDILTKIVEKTKERVSNLKNKTPLSVVREMALNSEKGYFRFEKALSNKDISFICEVKKASPSKGVIAEKFPYIEIAKDYEKAGASAISVLTEPYFFLGSDDYLTQISKSVDIPILRKDFIIDEYQIYEAKNIGASAVLLICSVLSQSQLEDFLCIADSLGLSSLVEAHDEEEIQKTIGAHARIIGVNNRNLKTFEVDINNSIKLRKFVPDNIIFVSESGISTYDDIKNLKNNKVDAVLIGETFMRSSNKTEELKKLRGEFS